MRRMVCILCFVTLFVLVVAAQQPTAPGSPAQGSQPIRVATKLVIEEVAVKDKGGKPIGGLTANDFTLTEDGVPQTISFVEFQQLQAAANSPDLTPSPSSAVPTAPPSRKRKLRQSSRVTRVTATTVYWLCISICPPCSPPISSGLSTLR